MIRIDQIRSEIWEGYTKCPKCGQKDKWADGGGVADGNGPVGGVGGDGGG